jgi:hypothetical protein
MSGHGDHAEAHGDEHDEHDDDHHAPPPLPEPATPLWLTLLGIGLFLVAGILFIATRSEGKTTAELSAEAPSAAVAVAPSAANPGAAPAPPGGAPPNGAARLNAPPNPPNGAGGGAARPSGRSQRPGHEGHDHD